MLKASRVVFILLYIFFSLALHAQSPADTLFSVKVDTLYGYENSRHEMVLPARYELAFPFRYGVAPVILFHGNPAQLQSALINTKGEFVVPPQPGKYNTFHRDSFCVIFQNSLTGMTERYTLQGEKYFECNKRFQMQTIDDSGRFVVSHRDKGLDTFQVYSAKGKFLYSVTGNTFRVIENHGFYAGEKTTRSGYWYIQKQAPDEKNKIRSSGPVMTTDGRIVYENGGYFHFYRGLGVCPRGNGYALVDLHFRERIPYSEGYTGMFYWGSTGCIAIVKDSLHGILDTNGAMVMRRIYLHSLGPEAGGLLFRENIPYSREQQGGAYFILRNGDTLVTPDYWIQSQFKLDSAGKPIPVVIKHTKTGKYGVVSCDSSVNIPARYDCLGPVSDRRIPFFNKDSAGYLNTKGEVVIRIDFPCDGLSAFHNGYALCAVRAPGGRAQHPGAQVVSDGQTTYARKFVWIDTTGQLAGGVGFDWASATIDGMTLVTLHLQTFAFDSTIKRMKVKGKYDYASYFDKGYAIISDGTRFGLVDSTGKIVIPVAHDGIGMNQVSAPSRGLMMRNGHTENSGHMGKIIPDIINGTIKVFDGKKEEVIVLPK
jgi:hypothetical protein